MNLDIIADWNELPIGKKYEASLPIAISLRNEASARVKGFLEASGKTAGTVADNIGVNRGGFSRFLKSRFSVPMDSMRKLAYGEFNVSIHSLFFGEKGITPLPKLLEEMVEECPNLEVEGQLSYVSRGASLNRRVQELAQDRATPIPDLCGKEVSQALKNSLRRIEAEPDFEPRINFLIFMTMHFNTTMDYFYSQNYARYTDVSVHGKVIQDSESLRFLRLYLEKEKIDREKIGGQALACGWK